MSLVMKGIALLAILLTVQLTESEARKHITHKRSRFTYGGGDAVLMPRTHNFHGESDENRVDTFISGQILCDGYGKLGIRPFLESPEYPGVIFDITYTNGKGWYRLSTGTLMEFQKNIYMVIRHQCKIEKLSYRRACAVQYYTTKVEINVNNNASFIERQVELSEMKEFSTANCL